LEMKRKLKVILGVDRLVDDFRQEAFPGDCPIYFVRDDYLSRQRAKFPLPPGLDLLLPEMHRLSAEELCYELLGSKRLGVTSPVGHGACVSDDSVQDAQFRELYACHDSTLILLLLGLECFDGQWPPFAADIILELYCSSESPSLDLSRKGKPQLTECPDETPSLVEPELEQPIDPSDLWIRVLYLGRVVPLACLWKLNSVDVELTSDGYVPLSALVDRWSEALNYKPPPEVSQK
uniref:Inositol-pentakisphosphate 2-kinase n=1 Tax=Echinostoma caproni TaxID=27848 RepID=A0A183ARQ7_9TREM